MEILKKIFSAGVLKYAIVIIIGVAVVGFMDENSIYSHIQNKEKIADLKAEIERNHANHQRDKSKIDALDNTQEAVERVAREKYYMKMPDEDIFVLSTDKQ